MHNTLTEGLPRWGVAQVGAVQIRDATFQAHPHRCVFRTAIVMLCPIDLYGGVTKCSHAVSDSLVISMNKIGASVPTLQSFASSVILHYFVGRHYFNSFLKLIANQHLKPFVSLCVQKHPFGITEHCQSRHDIQQDHVPLHPLRSPLQRMLGRWHSKSPWGLVLKVL